MIGEAIGSRLHGFREYFRSAFDGKDPFPFQMGVARELLAGNNVVALAPTGSGKTLAPVAAFSYARRNGLDLADRLIYALPQRTLTVALRDSVKHMLERAEPDLRVTIQTGTMPEDPYLEGDVIFTTIDQLLSAYIEVPVSLPKRLANIPAGALLGSLVVFDEFHLLEPGRALATALDLAVQLRPFSRTLLMSATFPRSGLEEILRRAQAVLVEVSPEEIATIPSQRNKRRTYVWHHEPLAAGAALDAHRDRTIVVVNRVDRAQELYCEIKQGVLDRGMEARVLLLHSRFLPEDRQQREGDVIALFKRDGAGRAILVATQVVEVGLDITCDTLHSEVATAAALFQRSGRCARYEDQDGTVHVYGLETTVRGRRYGPYRSSASIVDALAACMEERSGKPLGFSAEQEVVNLTHGDAEMRQLGEVAASRRDEVVKAQRDHESAYVRRLIRSVDSVNLVIHSDPAILELGTRPETFSIPRSVLQQFLARLDLDGDDAGKVRWPDFPADSEAYGQSPEWKPLLRPADATRHLLLAVHPSLISYDPDTGLRLLPSRVGEYQSRSNPTHEDTRLERYSYEVEMYSEHARRVLQETNRILRRHCQAVRRVAHGLGLSHDDVVRLAQVAAVTHDLGKLSSGVQDAMWRWMVDVHGERRGGLLAHTTFDARDPRQVALARERRFRKPPHAVEGAIAATPALVEAVRRLAPPQDVGRDVVLALFSTIARHHSPSARTARPFTLAAGASQEAADSLDDLELAVDLVDRPSELQLQTLQELFVDPANAAVYPLYLLLVRLLRIADQRATARKE